eukprot:Phypoly_transcript_06251.p1 GENE.Phypoly_transcript_06251~~Phypoly_transcript_06251.p1  ORF type:complete len:570 (+),score=156.85 Phypoly_transcript_06251:64-1710(+)
MDPSTLAGHNGDYINTLVYNLHSNLPMNNTPDASTIPFSPLPVNTSLPQPAKKRASFTACAACQSKHCACDEQRPCSRCVRLRLACTEGVPRKGKTKKKPQKEAQKLVPPDPYAALERELLTGKYPTTWSSAIPISTPPPTTLPANQATFPATPTLPVNPSTYPPTPSTFPSTPSTLPSTFPSASVAPTDFPSNITFQFLSASIPLPPLEPISTYDLDTDTTIAFDNNYSDFAAIPPMTPSQVLSESTSSQSPFTPSQPTPSQPTPSPPVEELSSSSSSSSSASSSSSPTSSSSSSSQFNPFLQPSESLSRSFAEHPYAQQTQTALATFAIATSLHPFSPSPLPLPTTPSQSSSSTSTRTSHTTPQNSPHFPPPPTPSTPSVSSPCCVSPPSPTDGSGATSPSDPGNAMVAGLQKELQELRRELAAVRHRDRIAFPLHQRVAPREVAMTLWSLNDGHLLDYSAGFLKLFNYSSQSADKLTFYDISPHATRAQRRHLLAYFLRERPEVNGVVTYKSVLHSSGGLLDVLCTSTVFYFEDSAMIQLIFFKP